MYEGGISEFVMISCHGRLNLTWQEFPSREILEKKWLTFFSLELENCIFISLFLLDFQDWEKILFLLSIYEILKRILFHFSIFKNFQENSLSTLDLRDFVHCFYVGTFTRQFCSVSEYGVYCPYRHRYKPRLDSPLTGDSGQDDWSLEALVWVDLWVVPVLGGGSRGPGGRTDVMERARGWTRAPWPGQWHFPLPVLNSDQWTHCLRHSCHSTAFPSIKGCCFCSQWHINSY